jgi:hypothetical protein
MNYMRKKSALAKCHAMLEEGKSMDDISDAMAQDSLNLTEDELIIVMEELMDEGKEIESPTPMPEPEPKSLKEIVAEQKPVSDAKPTSRVGDLIDFYKFAVKPVNDTIVLRGRKEVILKGYTKIGECLQVTSLEERHAEILNQQVPNALIYYYKDGEDDLLPAENFF